MSQTLERLFAEAFAADFNTRLQGGAEEPFYEASKQGQAAIIHYRHDYFASALHEVAHWCVAGEARRQQDDYDYWYAADGRSEAQQALFEQVEVQPQALEWVFSVASAQPFRVSADNLSLGLGPSEAFKQAISERVHVFCEQGLPARASRFVAVLSRHYGGDEPLKRSHYSLQAL